jgi:hypothetical protein
VSFDVPPEERAESFTVTIPAGGGKPRVRHVLPEGRPGESLTEEDARALALEELRVRLDLEPAETREISAVETSRPARTDWTFVFQRSEGFPLSAGEGRSEVGISGQEVSEIRSFVHIPEAWEREWRSDSSRRALVLIPMGAILGLAALGGLILAIVRWSRGALDVKTLRVLFVVMIPIMLVTSVNDWPLTMSAFTTQTSFGNQMGIALLGSGFAVFMVAMGIGLFGAMGHTWVGRNQPSTSRPALLGLAAGSAYVGVMALLSSSGPDAPPAPPSLSTAVSFLPWLSLASAAVVGYMLTTSGGLFVLPALERLRSTRWGWVRFIVLALIGLTAAPNPPGNPWWLWIGSAAGVSTGVLVLLFLCRRLGWAILPGAVAAPVLLGSLGTMIQAPHPGSLFGSVLGVVAVGAALYYWTRALSGRAGESPSPSRGNDVPGTMSESTFENAN